MNAWQPEMDGFDAVYSSNLLQWAENPLSVITHWKRCLHATGGHIHAVLSIRRCVNCENSYLMDSYLYDGVLETTGIICSNQSYEDSFSRAEEHIHWHRDAMELFRLFKNTGVNSS